MNIFERLSQHNQEEDFSNISSRSNSVVDEENIFERLSKKQIEKEENRFGIFETLKDIGQQALAKGAAGIGGAYGNILDALGLQQQPGQITPGQAQRYAQEF